MVHGMNIKEFQKLILIFLPMESVFRINKIALIILLGLMSCKTKTYTINEFNFNKDKILSAWQNISLMLSDNDEILITSFKKDIRICCSIGNSNTITFYLDKNEFTYIGHSVDTLLINENKPKFDSLYNKINQIEFRKNIKELVEIGVKGIKIKNDWFFITFGVKGEKLKNPDINNGVLITNNKDVKSLFNC